MHVPVGCAYTYVCACSLWGHACTMWVYACTREDVHAPVYLQRLAQGVGVFSCSLFFQVESSLTLSISFLDSAENHQGLTIFLSLLPSGVELHMCTRTHGLLHGYLDSNINLHDCGWSTLFCLFLVHPDQQFPLPPLLPVRLPFPQKEQSHSDIN